MSTKDDQSPTLVSRLGGDLKQLTPEEQRAQLETRREEYRQVADCFTEEIRRKLYEMENHRMHPSQILISIKLYDALSAFLHYEMSLASSSELGWFPVLSALYPSTPGHVYKIFGIDMNATDMLVGAEIIIFYLDDRYLRGEMEETQKALDELMPRTLGTYQGDVT